MVFRFHTMSNAKDSLFKLARVRSRPVNQGACKVDLDPLVQSGDVARMCGVSTETLRKWRRKGKGPLGAVKVSKTNTSYRLSKVREFLESLGTKEFAYSPLRSRRNASVGMTLPNFRASALRPDPAQARPSITKARHCRCGNSSYDLAPPQVR